MNPIRVDERCFDERAPPHIVHIASPSPPLLHPHPTRTHAQARGISVEGRLFISDRAHLLFELHKEIDGAREAELAGTGKQVQRLQGGAGRGGYSARAGTAASGWRGEAINLVAVVKSIQSTPSHHPS